jgi:hypothetical protein
MGQWVESWGPGWRTVIVIDLEIGDGPSIVSMKQSISEYHHVFKSRDGVVEGTEGRVHNMMRCCTGLKRATNGGCSRSGVIQVGSPCSSTLPRFPPQVQRVCTWNGTKAFSLPCMGCSGARGPQGCCRAKYSTAFPDVQENGKAGKDEVRAAGRYLSGRVDVLDWSWMVLVSPLVSCLCLS